MASRRVEPLTYGSLGHAWYNTETQLWEFQKLPQNKHRLQQVSPTRILSAPVLPPLDEDPVTFFRERSKRLRELLRKEPETAPADSTIFELSYASEAIERVPTDYDPDISDLLATGWAGPKNERFDKVNHKNRDRDADKAHVRPFLACPCGLSRETLRIIGFKTSEDQSVDEATARELLVHRLGTKSDAEWTGSAVTSIQQICVSMPLNGTASYMAARRLSGTAIFKPCWSWSTPDHTGKLQITWSTGFLFEIHMSDTGGAEHIDVAHNPWREEHFAILDRRGHWSLFSLEQRYGRFPYRFDATSAPRPGFEYLETPGDIGVKCSGAWGRLVFAAQGYLLVVCSRRDWGVFTIGIPARRVKMPDMHLLNKDDIILDLKRDPSNPEMIFILTSSQLHWIHLAEGLAIAEATTIIDPRLVLSWHHSWDSSTFVMRLIVSSVKHSETLEGSTRELSSTSTLATIHGRGTEILEIYETRYHKDTSRGVALGDPYLIDLRTSNAKTRKTPTATISFLLESIKLPNLAALSNGHSSEGADSRYFQFLGLDARLGISQTIFWSSSSQIRPPTVSLSRLGLREDSRRMNIEPALVDVSDQSFQAGVEHGAPSKDRSALRRNSRWVCERIYHDGLAGSAKQLTEEELSRKLKEIGDAQLGHGVKLLQDVVPSGFDAHNPEAASKMIERHLQRLESSSSSELIVDSVLTPHMRQLLMNAPDAQQNASLSQIIDYMHSTWIAPLPNNISDETKNSLDKLMRQVALEVFLCSIGLHPITSVSKDPPLSAAEPKSTDSQHKTKEKSKGQGKIKAEDPSQTQTQTQSQDSEAVMSQPFSSTQGEGDRPIYSPSASIAHLLPHPAPASLQDPTGVLARITDEWVVGADPAGYDWTRVRGIESGTLAPLQQHDPVPADGIDLDAEALGSQSQSQSQTQMQSQNQSQSQSQRRTERKEGKSKNDKNKKRRQGF